MALGAFRNKSGVLENEKGAVEERDKGSVAFSAPTQTITPIATAQYSRYRKAETEAVSGKGDNRSSSADAAAYQSKQSSFCLCPTKFSFALSGLLVMVVQRSSPRGKFDTNTESVGTSQQTNTSSSRIIHRQCTRGESFGPDHASIGSLLTSGWSLAGCIGLPKRSNSALTPITA
jgi:hypothetical protein